MEEFLDLLFIEHSNGLIELNTIGKLEYRFREIVSRDPGRVVKGERVKELARMEISYIYLTLKPNYMEGFKADQRREIIKQRVGLKETWEPDKLILQTISDIQKDSITSHERLLALAQQNVQDYIVLYEEIGEYNRKLVKILQDVDLENGTDEELVLRKDAINQAKEHAKTLTTSLKEMQQNIALVQSLKETIKVNKGKEKRKKDNRAETDHSLYKQNAKF